MSSIVDDKEMLIFVEDFEFGVFVYFANSIPEVIDTFGERTITLVNGKTK